MNNFIGGRTLGILRPFKRVFDSALHGIHIARSESELALGMKPLSPPKANITKAKSIRKVIFAAMKYDYGSEERGPSPECVSFYDSLCSLAEVVPFDFMTLYKQHGKRKMNEMFMKEIEKEDPDLIFFLLFTEQFEKKIVKKISEESRAITFNWFADDHWRFDNFSRYWAPCFNFCSTTDEWAFQRYRRLGYHNIIMTQWGSNEKIYKRTDIPQDIDVSFVGQAHSDRKKIIEDLRKCGINVECFGSGWPNGRISLDEMIGIFNRSKINLNFAAASIGSSKQIKGRTFEIPICGGFLLSEQAPYLEKYYNFGKEIGIFNGTDELIEKIRYYLSHNDERKKIARAGYERTLKEHIYKKRFQDIFSKILATS